MKFRFVLITMVVILSLFACFWLAVEKSEAEIDLGEFIILQ